MGELISKWQVDYGNGDSMEVQVPHAWGQDADVRFEGPVTYTTQVRIPRGGGLLRFQAVSYEAIVSIAGSEVLTHRGMWDAFEVDLNPWSGRVVDVKVEVTKNGGDRFPVKDVASGFLPYVFHTFGGIWGEVRLLGKRTQHDGAEAECLGSRVAVMDSRIYVDGEPFYIRGLLHWGWYPEIGHPNPSEDVIRAEVQAAKELGFNLVKFCLWVPPERYLQILAEEGMEAWLELPLWDPSSDSQKLEEIASEIERIVRQYAHHDNIIVWTVGCELSHATPPEYRAHLVQLVKNLTGCPLVKDNSGGAEMYGGDLREFGDLYDYHPYCDTPFYPVVLDSLLPGARAAMPVLLGEFNDADVHRDLTRIHQEMPFWASSMPELNDVGVRWQHDLPTFLQVNPMALGDEFERHEKLMTSTREKALFMRKTVHEAVRARDPIAGYVITGWRDTPISTAGMFDDWGQVRYSADECRPWNGPDALFLIPTRRPPWVDGGNRPGWLDPYNHFIGQVFFRVGCHSQAGLEGGLIWRVISNRGDLIARGALTRLEIEPLTSTEVGQISIEIEEPGAYLLEVELAGTNNRWSFHVESPLDPDSLVEWELDDPRQQCGGKGFGEGPNRIFVGHVDGLAETLAEGDNAIVILDGPGTKAAPFWRESGYEFREKAPFEGQWERLLAVSGDRVLDWQSLAENLPPNYQIETILNRVDVRTYVEAPILVRASGNGGTAILTTLRPHGGLGVQPQGISRNPAGCALLRALMDMTQ